MPNFTPKKKKQGNGAGKPYSPTIARYTYRLADGTPYLQVQRTANKNFPQYHWDGEKWISDAPKGAKVPYRLPELIAAPPTTPVYVCEGEKDCDNLAKLGFVATCNSGGADNGNGGKWTPDLNEHFKDRHIYILPDNDHAGRVHAQYVARSLDLIAASVRVVELPGLPPKGDVSNWLENDPTGAQLVQQCKAASLWDPATASVHSVNDKELINELAALEPLEYAKRRKEAAETIGIGVTELDKIVAEARGDESEPTPDRWTVEPWSEEVATADLLQGLADIYRKHVVLPEHGAEVLALWNLHCWAIEAAYVSPFLMLTSPEMRCGKSTTLALLWRTAPRTAFASNISTAAVFRYIDACHPVLLIDEADTFARDDEALRGILNSGHSRDTAFVIRCEGDDNKPQEFSTWAPKAVAAIGKLPDTWRDRSIILPLKRKKPDEIVTKLRAKDNDAFINLRRKAARWVSDNIEALKVAQPDLPEALNDRAQDNWEGLLSIADLAGGDWPRKARAAAIALSSSAEATDNTIGVQLLSDIDAAFAGLNHPDRLFSKRLLTELTADETKLWASFKNGKPITERQLARILAGFGIRPGNQRIGDTQAKGYLWADFADALERYVPRGRGSGSVPASQVNDLNNLDLNSYVPKQSETDRGTDKNNDKPLETKDWDAGTDKNPRTSEKRTCEQCKGPVNGTERQHECADGRMVWLHKECVRFFEENRPW